MRFLWDFLHIFRKIMKISKIFLFLLSHSEKLFHYLLNFLIYENVNDFYFLWMQGWNPTACDFRILLLFLIFFGILDVMQHFFWSFVDIFAFIFGFLVFFHFIGDYLFLHIFLIFFFGEGNPKPEYFHLFCIDTFRICDLHAGLIFSYFMFILCYFLIPIFI